jgi:hypothetical protein
LLERRNKYIAEKEEKEKAKTTTESSSTTEDGSAPETILEDANMFETESTLNVKNETLPQTEENKEIIIEKENEKCELIEVKISNLSSSNSNESESIFSNKINKNESQTDLLITNKLIISDGKYCFLKPLVYLIEHLMF